MAQQQWNTMSCVRFSDTNTAYWHGTATMRQNELCQVQWHEHSILTWHSSRETECVVLHSVTQTQRTDMAQQRWDSLCSDKVVAKWLPNAIPRKHLDSAFKAIAVYSPEWKFLRKVVLCQMVSWLPTTWGCEIPAQFSCMPSRSFFAEAMYFSDTLFFLSCHSLSRACIWAFRPMKSVGSRCWHSCLGPGGRGTNFTEVTYPSSSTHLEHCG